MITIKINNNITKKELDAIMLERRPEFTMIDDNTGTIGNYAIVEIYLFANDDFDDEKESVADLCKRYTNEEIMQALILMTYEKVDYFDRLPKYIDEFNRSLKSGEPMRFFPDATNEKEIREYLKDESRFPGANDEDLEKEANETLEKYGDDYFYTPIGTINLNRLY